MSPSARQPENSYQFRAGTAAPTDTAALAGRQWSRLCLIEALYRRPASRKELIAISGLSRPTVSSLVEELTAAGIIEEVSASEARAPRNSGRPPRLLSLVRRAAYAIGLDFGHDHVRIAVCDLAGELVRHESSPADVDHAPVASLDLAYELVRESLRQAQIRPDRLLGIGMGIAAPVDSTSGAVQSEGILPGWHGIRPAEEMQSRLGLPTQVDNDANLGALGEREFGCGQGVGNMIYIRLSTGVGAGLILDGRPFGGATGIAGEIGHFRHTDDGAICRCGNRGCLETVASPVAVATLLERSRGEPVSVHRLLELVAAGDRGARRAVTDAGTAVGQAIASSVNLLNPELVAVGGDLAAAGEVILEPIRGAIQRHAVSPAANSVRVQRGALGGRAEVLGAAALILTQSPRVLAQQVNSMRAPRRARI